MRRSGFVAFALLVLATLPACNTSNAPTQIDPVPKGTIAITLLPSSALVAPGGVGSVGLSVSRGGGFAGGVTLTASGVPAGVSITFGSTTVSDGVFSTSVNIAVAASVAASSTPISITIVGSGGGVTSPGVTLSLRTA